MDVEDLLDKATVYAGQQGNPPILLAFLSLGGFTAEAQTFCTQHGIATAEEIHYVWRKAA